MLVHLIFREDHCTNLLLSEECYSISINNYHKNDNGIKVKVEDKDIINQIQHLIDELKQDGMIIRKKNNYEFEVIKKSRCQMDVDLHISNNYTAVYFNE